METGGMRVDHHFFAYIQAQNSRRGTKWSMFNNYSKRIQIEYAMDPRFKIQGGGESLVHNLES